MLGAQQYDKLSCLPAYPMKALNINTYDAGLTHGTPQGNITIDVTDRMPYSEGALVHFRVPSTISYRIREALVLFFQVSRFPGHENQMNMQVQVQVQVKFDYVIHPTSANIETKTFCTCTYIRTQSQKALNQHSISGRIRQEKPWIIKTISCGYNFRKIEPAQLLFKGLASRCCSR